MDQELLDKNWLDKEGFGKWLKGRLLDRHLSQRAFARLTGISPTQIARYIAGEQMPTRIRYINKMAVVLNIPPDELFTRVGMEPVNFEVLKQSSLYQELLQKYSPDEIERIFDIVVGLA